MVGVQGEACPIGHAENPRLWPLDEVSCPRR